MSYYYLNMGGLSDVGFKALSSNTFNVTIEMKALSLFLVTLYTYIHVATFWAIK